ncbi:type II toxin-antitoxin system PemK/MazF family toxin [Rubrivirga sp.]|uniref:type II toxin-antitoxin system PemK/MazF family toxin n=1 Tax=Rubrivirga sp. TaxID=1885344 RepID=UPI003C768612
MGSPPVTRGSVVLVRFPFSDLSSSKRRPAVVLADAGRGDYVLVQVTSRSYSDPNAVELTEQSFARGGLRLTSYARPGKLFTANDSLIVREMGVLDDSTLSKLVEAVIELLGG